MKCSAHFDSVEWDQKRPFEPYPGQWVNSRLVPLCDQLEVLRAALGGKAVTIISGYRTEAYNRAIGGARFSQHVQGRAADIKVKDVPAAVVHDTALRLYNEGKLKIGGLGRYETWTHIDARSGSRLARWTGSRK